MGPGLRQDDETGSPSHRRQHPVAAIIRIKFSAALAADGGATRRGGSGFRNAEGATEAVGAFGPGGVGRAGGTDAEYQQRGGNDLDR